jgi:hypothetical protein
MMQNRVVSRSHRQDLGFSVERAFKDLGNFEDILLDKALSHDFLSKWPLFWYRCVGWTRHPLQITLQQLLRAALKSLRKAGREEHSKGDFRMTHDSQFLRV